MKIEPVPSAGGVAGLRNGDTLVLGNTGASRCGELADDPAVGELIVDDYRIAVAAILAGAAKAGPN